MSEPRLTNDKNALRKFIVEAKHYAKWIVKEVNIKCVI
jgi:hypothetical protein